MKRFSIKTLTALFVAAVLMLSTLVEPAQSDSYWDPEPERVNLLLQLLPWPDSPGNIRSAIKRGELTADDLEKLDFTLPGEKGFDETSNFSVVRILESRPKATAEFFRKRGHYGNQEVIDAITTVKGNRLIFNLRRMTNDDKLITDILYAVLPDIDPHRCSTEDGGRGNLTVYKAGPEFVVAPNHHTVVDLPADFKRHENNRAHGLTCVYLPDGKKYLFIELYVRLKLKGEKEWRMY